MIKLFWLLLSLGCVGWYMFVLVYVTIRGAVDIKSMLKRMSAEGDGGEPGAGEH